MNNDIDWRRTSQDLAPSRHEPSKSGAYDVYPGFPVGPGQIANGFDALAEWLADHPVVTIDGYVGVLWNDFRERLDAALTARGLSVSWTDVSNALRPTDEVERLCAPFLGGDDPLFGTRFTGSLADFFNADGLRALTPSADSDISIIYGCGASLARWDSLLVYVDIPKNEIQFRSRAGRVPNLGCTEANDPKPTYKRFYFVDWIALNAHKAALLPVIDIIVDSQRPDDPAIMRGANLRTGLDTMAQNYFRVRPWFEPGPWGGQWIKEKIPELPRDVPNYAWSFELIVPENGIAFESDGALLEVSFDMLMAHDNHAVLGDTSDRFGRDFPVRYDFLDTFDGGNLSLQCHPRPEFAKKHFGEPFTQDETYYMLDCAPGAEVYLGFNEDIDPEAFRAALETSQAENVPLDAKRFVNTEPATKHDLFLIPSGTVHCSGIDNMVLEISATPYIFTFKMHDWLRLGLDGEPRPLNIERAFDNLVFERKGDRIRAELVSRPSVLESGDGWQLEHLPTHVEHFYDVHRVTVTDAYDAQTNGSCQIMSLVEGTSVILETAGGMRQRFNYAETFVVPAAAGSFRLTNEGDAPAMVLKTFLKKP